MFTLLCVGIVLCAMSAFIFWCYTEKVKLGQIQGTILAEENRSTNQQEDIYNISSRVQGQGQWPTHDAHVSLDNFAITNELNKYNDDPPTYEEAMSIATSINNNTVVPAVVPKTTITPTSTTATSTSN
ncbi:uncharacterized protein [Tenebrio molitor]|jgi:hypothetical protein|uniref:uncharacterized protein isoform X8 n=1 Tax=Tenebrio molitor TaxID=7067 RepID=UPI003624A563